MPSNLFSRRAAVSLGAAALLATSSAPVLALTEGEARRLVDSLVADINKVIASGKSENAMITDFERIFARYADVAIMARYALGVDGRSASKSQMRSFTQAFQGYIARKYGRRFREFIGGRLEVQTARKIKNGYELKSTAFLQGRSPFEVVFHISDRSGRDLFYNLYIEGVSLLLTERTEIGSMLDSRRGDIDRLTADLRKMG